MVRAEKRIVIRFQKEAEKVEEIVFAQESSKTD